MTLRFKRGDTLFLYIHDDDTDLSDVTIESAVKLGSSFYQALTVGDINVSAGTFTLSGASDSYPIGSLDCDIKYTVTSGTTRTETFQIMINPEVTR